MDKKKKKIQSIVLLFISFMLIAGLKYLLCASYPIPNGVINEELNQGNNTGKVHSVNNPFTAEDTNQASNENKKSGNLAKDKDIIAENAKEIAEYLKKDYNVEVDINILNFTKGSHLSEEEKQKIAELPENGKSRIKILNLEKGIEELTQQDLTKMKELCGTGCIMHLMDDKSIYILNMMD